MITSDQELKATLARIQHFQAQVAHLRSAVSKIARKNLLRRVRARQMATPEPISRANR
jgi:hypothetical protein